MLLRSFQVAVDRTSPNGRVIGIDLIPTQPLSGVSTIQGDFLSEVVQDEVKRFISEPSKSAQTQSFPRVFDKNYTMTELGDVVSFVPVTTKSILPTLPRVGSKESYPKIGSSGDAMVARMVDVVLSDMSAPRKLKPGFWKRSLAEPYCRMMNTSGMAFRDHAGSMVSILLILLLHEQRLILWYQRISAMRHYDSALIHSRSEVPLFANSIKEPRIRHLKEN